MMGATVKTETLSVPGFFERFSRYADLKELCRSLREEGYTHYLTLRTPRVTVGNVEDEYRVLVGAAFFKGTPPDFDLLKTGESDDTFPIIEQRKYYAMMSSVGRSGFTARLNASEFAEWIEFFKSQAGSIREIKELI